MGPQARSVPLSRVDASCAVFLGALALALRVGGLTLHGLYRDDAWVALAHRVDVGNAVQFGITIPGFELFIKAWASISSATMWLQLPELVASVAAVVLCYYLARRLGCTPAAALVAGAILAVSPIAVIFATRVKPYSFDVLSCVIVLLLAVRLLESPTTRRAIGLGAVSLLAVAASASVLPVAAAAVAWTSWRVRKTSRVPIAVAVSFAVVVAAYATVVLAAVPASLKAFWRDNYITGASSATNAFKTFAAGLFTLHGPTTVGLVILAFIAVGVVWARPDLAPLLLGPVAIAAGLAIGKRVPFGGGRTDLYLYPCLAIAAALSVQRVLETRQLQRLPAVTVFVSVVVLLIAVVDGRRALIRVPYPSADLAELASAVNLRRMPGDGVVVAPYSRYGFAFVMEPTPRIVVSSNYSTRFTVASRDPDVLLMPAEYYEGGYDAGDALTFADDRTRIFYVATDTPESDTPLNVQAKEYEPEQLLIQNGYMVAERLDAHGAHVDLLVRRDRGT